VLCRGKLPFCPLMDNGNGMIQKCSGHLSDLRSEMTQGSADSMFIET